MAGSPFEIFRRNQKQLMVVLTGLSMFAFIFLDMLTNNQSGQMPLSMGMLLIAALCAGGFWFIGSRRGKGTEYALWGALLGAVVGFISYQNRTSAAVVDTSIGSFSRADLQRMAQRRSIANRFVAVASKGQAGMFGGTDDRQMVMRALLLNEARQQSIAVTDDAVNEFIQRITNKHLPLPEYKKLLRDLDLGEAELFDVLREELAARFVLEMDYPPRQRFGQGTVQTPLGYWKTFQMLQVRQALDAVEIPVEAFVSLVPEPTDAELDKFYDAYKNRLPSSDGKPGFLRDRQVQLAYVAADFEAFEKLSEEPTDDEVAEYYEKNKQRYRVTTLPDMTGHAKDASEDPASALDPANSPQPTAPARPPEPPLPEDGGACGLVEPENDQPVTEAEQDAKPATESKPADVKPEDAKANAKSDDPLLLLPPSAGQPELKLPPGVGTSFGESSPFEEPKYRELDDALKLEIRETILRERAFAKMRGAADLALEEMTKLADQYLEALDDEARAKKAVELTQSLKAYAEAHKLQYVETPPMTQQELMSSLEEPIGQAMEPGANPFLGRSETVATEAFANDALYYPRRVDSILRDKSYAYWKIADLPAKVPEFKDVKDDVVAAWKLDRARPLAEKRAKDLADLVRQSDKPMAEALAGQTVTGVADAAAAVVKQTPRFSWLNVPRSLPFQFNQGFSMPQISVVEGVKQPGNEFMTTVFDDLGPGETGVAPNQTRNEFYVVQVKQRDASPAEDGDNLGLRSLQQQFLLEGKSGFFTSAYMVLASMPQTEFEMRWQDDFEKRHKVVWHEQDEPEMPPGT